MINNIPENMDVLTELPSEGDKLDYTDQIINESVDEILTEIEAYILDDYYHEEFV